MLRTAGCKITSPDENGDDARSGGEKKLRLAGEDGIGRLRPAFKGKETGEPGS
jgi:hypothetical protein